MSGTKATPTKTKACADSDVTLQDALREGLQKALGALLAKESTPVQFDLPIQLERTQDSKHGDFATNLALQLAKSLKAKPRDIAVRLLEHLPVLSQIEKVEIAGPGFINFHAKHGSWQGVVESILRQGERYGHADDSGVCVHIEFVSANPTGPLHVGHGRGAAYGSCLANLLKACGQRVSCEYYVNDSGRQIGVLMLSLWMSYLRACGEKPIDLSRVYRGEYIDEYAHELLKQHDKKFLKKNMEWPVSAMPGDRDDEEQALDACIDLMRAQLTTEHIELLREFAVSRIMNGIRSELNEFRVVFDNWFLESSLGPDKIDHAIEQLTGTGHIDERDGNIWFLSTRFGDDRDRVLRRKNGLPTYFAADVAYHIEKFKHHTGHIINVWGADHHGYVARVRAALKALELNADRLEIQLVQLVNLRRGSEKMTMSTRSGEYVSLSALREEVGVDATRFFYIMRRIDQGADFDLELAKTTNKDNPVYYIQYAHARICSMQRTMKNEGIDWDQSAAMGTLDLLRQTEELQLLRRISDYPDLIQRAGAERAPHLLATFLNQLAADFHVCYNKHRVLTEDPELRNARIALAYAVRQTIANGLKILSVDAPEQM
jgi:arginyl-tRNA synthetase